MAQVREVTQWEKHSVTGIIKYGINLLQMFSFWFIQNINSRLLKEENSDFSYCYEWMWIFLHYYKQTQDVTFAAALS